MMNNNAPDARHLISVARNLLWQAHAGFQECAKPSDIAYQNDQCLRASLKGIISLIDCLRDVVHNHTPAHCQHTTMPPGHDDAWLHFLDYVQACYLPKSQPPRLTDAEREAVETSFDAMQYAADELGLSQADCDRLVATLRGLLERLK